MKGLLIKSKGEVLIYFIIPAQIKTIFLRCHFVIILFKLRNVFMLIIYYILIACGHTSSRELNKVAVQNSSGISPDCQIIVKLLIQIDPTRTASAGKVNLGAFRTYPKVSVTFLCQLHYLYSMSIYQY